MSEVNTKPYTLEEQELAYQKTLTVTSVVLVRMLKLINICTERGTFKSEELTFVGKLYDDLKGGVDQTLVLARKELEEAAAKKLETIQEEEEESTDAPTEETLVEETEEVSDTIQVKNSAGVQTVSN